MSSLPDASQPVNESHVYEIINPSDHYTMEGPLGPCSVALLLVGPSGGYALESEDGSDGFPILLFGGESELQAACEKVGIWPLQDYVDAHRPEVIAALRSVVIGNRKVFVETLAILEGDEARDRFRATWHETNRSSLNDIGGRAQRIAHKLEEASR